MEISYRHTIQVRPYESITIEVKRNVEEHDEAFDTVFNREVKSLENAVDTELELKALELAESTEV